MGQIQLLAEIHGQRLEQARQLFFDQGTLPDGLIDPVILRSWERCRRFGLGEGHAIPAVEAMDRVALKTEQDRNRFLLAQGRPIMEHVYEQIRESGSMVILADANGLLLETVGDAEFGIDGEQQGQAAPRGTKTSAAPTPSAPHCPKKPQSPSWAASIFLSTTAF